MPPPTNSAIRNPQSAISPGLPLNPLDLALCCVDRVIRGIGYPGFETQMLVWLSERADVPRLRSAVTQLSRRHPVITSQLQERVAEDDGDAFWKFQPDRQAALTELDVVSADPDGVLACAGELLSTPRDPAESPPLRFYLLHRTGGSDVFLMQYSHVLMDNSASPLVVRAIDRLARSDGADQSPCGERRLTMSDYVRQFSHAQRRSAVASAIDVNGRVLRGRAAIVGTGQEDASLIYRGADATSGQRQVRLRIASRSLSPEQTRALHRQTVKLCGLPSLSMAILGSTFRAIRQLGPAERNAQRNYVAGIGLDLNLRSAGLPLFQNLLSIVPIGASPDELDARGELVQSLSRQMRSRLEAKIDLGIVRLATGFQSRVRHMRWALEHLLRYSYSLWYAYFGALDAVGPKFCGTPVENVFYVGPAWSPMGIGLLANQFAGRLCLALTYDPHLVSESLANSLLDVTLGDLL